MEKKKLFIILILILPILWGCATFSFAPQRPAVVAQDTYTPAMFKSDLALYQEPKANVEVRTNLRNKMVYGISKAIDINYLTYRNSFFGERAFVDTALDIGMLGLSAAGVMASKGTANLLAAIATGIGGSRLSFNKNFWRDKNPDLFLLRMDALRAEWWLQIYTKLGENDNTYSFYEAEKDLFVYYDRGSIQAAILSIIGESGATQRDAAQELRQIRRGL